MVYMGEYDIEHFFDKGQESDIGEDKVFDELRSLLTSDNNVDIIFSCMKLKQMLNLGIIDKVLIRYDTKLKSFQQRWFRAQKKESQFVEMRNNNNDCNDKYDIYIEWNTLITLNCK